MASTLLFTCSTQVITAHGPGVPAPNIHDGTPTLQGVRALALRANRTELVSGGADGQIIVWDITTGVVGRVIKTIQVWRLPAKAFRHAVREETAWLL